MHTSAKATKSSYSKPGHKLESFVDQQSSQAYASSGYTKKSDVGAAIGSSTFESQPRLGASESTFLHSGTGSFPGSMRAKQSQSVAGEPSAQHLDK